MGYLGWRFVLKILALNSTYLATIHTFQKVEIIKGKHNRIY